MRRRLVVWGFIILAVIALGAVVVQRELRGGERLPAVPEELTTRASIPGIPGARYWVGTEIEPYVRDVVAARKREEEFLARSGHTCWPSPAAATRAPSAPGCFADGPPRGTARRSKPRPGSAPERSSLRSPSWGPNTITYCGRSTRRSRSRT